MRSAPFLRVSSPTRTTALPSCATTPKPRTALLPSTRSPAPARQRRYLTLRNGARSSKCAHRCHREMQPAAEPNSAQNGCQIEPTAGFETFSTMRRRSFTEEQTSRLAIWARRIALFSLAATFIAIVIVRSGALDIVPALSTLAGALVLAIVAILLALGAGISIWREGLAGGRQAATALLIGFALIAYPLYLGVKARNLPAIYDITTDPIDPPQFDAIARLRPRDANPVTYAGLYTAEQQHNAYADIEPDDTNSSAQEAYDAAMKVITRRKWRVVDARPPQAPLPVPTPRNVAIQASPARDGIIEAVARTPILGLRDDV